MCRCCFHFPSPGSRKEKVISRSFPAQNLTGYIPAEVQTPRIPMPSKLSEPAFPTLKQILRATQNFSPSTMIGDGVSGTVYRACLDDGRIVAIKRANKEMFEHVRTKFRSEVALLSRIDHRNLVKFLGYFEEGNEHLIIMEFVPNGTLREHLDGDRGQALSFGQRLEISIEIASALTYLHMYAEKPVIHRDMKSTSVLLTDTMRVKVTDFGFARVGPTEEGETHVRTGMKGTLGYMDPEYMKTYNLSPKSDVYSFGILLVEIFSGRRPIAPMRPVHERITIRWAHALYLEGDVLAILDPAVAHSVAVHVASAVFDLAMQCAAPRRTDRPTMHAVGKRLWSIRKEFQTISAVPPV